MTNSAGLRLRSVIALTPPYSYTNEEIAHVLRLPILPKVCRGIGIHARRTFFPLDFDTGKVVGERNEEDEVRIAAEVGRKAIEEARISHDDIAALYLISCTVRRGKHLHFDWAAHQLILHLGLKTNIHVIQQDVGCDGFVNALGDFHQLLRLDAGENALIVVTSLPSTYVDRERCALLPREEQFPNFVFGDGAAAAVLSVDESAGGGIIRATYGAVDASVDLAWTSTSCDAAGKNPEFSFAIDYGLVGASYTPAIEAAIRGLKEECPSFDISEVDRVYFHQANAILPLQAAKKLRIPADKVAMAAHEDGNTAAASVPNMLAKDIRKGVIGKGSRILLAAVGAGMAYSAALVEY